MSVSPSPSEMAAMVLPRIAAALFDSGPGGTPCAGRSPGRVAR